VANAPHNQSEETKGIHGYQTMKTDKLFQSAFKLREAAWRFVEACQQRVKDVHDSQAALANKRLLRAARVYAKEYEKRKGQK
jgi:hypothetical protein